MTDTRKKRPRDPAQLAKLMIDIASGEVEDREPPIRSRRTNSGPFGSSREISPNG